MGPVEPREKATPVAPLEPISCQFCRKLSPMDPPPRILHSSRNQLPVRMFCRSSATKRGGRGPHTVGGLGAFLEQQGSTSLCLSHPQPIPGLNPSLPRCWAPLRLCPARRGSRRRRSRHEFRSYGCPRGRNAVGDASRFVPLRILHRCPNPSPPRVSPFRFSHGRSHLPATLSITWNLGLRAGRKGEGSSQMGTKLSGLGWEVVCTSDMQSSHNRGSVTGVIWPINTLMVF